jgi:hypothetical protein
MVTAVPNKPVVDCSTDFTALLISFKVINQTDSAKVEAFYGNSTQIGDTF